MSDSKAYRFSNKTKNTNAQCKIVVYRWDVDTEPTKDWSEAELSASQRLEISSQIMTASYNKSMSDPAGNFNFTLSNSPGQVGNNISNDWKDIIKKGSWCLIYMSNDGTLELNPNVGPNNAKSKAAENKYLRCIGYIERITPKFTMEETGGHSLVYEVSGRDFGVIYNETTIWHNMFRYEESMLQNVSNTKMDITGNTSLDQAIDLIHDLFYYPSNIPGAKVNDKQSLNEIGLQWLLPREMVQDLGYDMSKLTKGTYWGALPGVKKFSTTKARVAISDPTAYLSGNAWTQLKQLSIPEFHELYTELDTSGKPRLIYRPVPWGINQQDYSRIAESIPLYREVYAITIPGVDVIDGDVSEDDHSRYNSFFVAISTSLINVIDSTNLLNASNFPRHNLNSVKRHGFRPMHTEIDSLVKNEELANGDADRNLLMDFNHLLLDYWQPSVYMESGTISKIGSNDVKVGICALFDEDTPYLTGKRYYIEGYTDVYAQEGEGKSSWTQELTLTRGCEQTDLNRKNVDGKRRTAFTAPDEYTPANMSKGGK